MTCGLKPDPTGWSCKRCAASWVRPSGKPDCLREPLFYYTPHYRFDSSFEPVVSFRDLAETVWYSYVVVPLIA